MTPSRLVQNCDTSGGDYIPIIGNRLLRSVNNGFVRDDDSLRGEIVEDGLAKAIVSPVVGRDEYVCAPQFLSEGGVS